jgi:hypothetical protein
MRHLKNMAEWPGNSAATRSIRRKTWTMILRCYECRVRFAIGKITVDRLALAPQVTACKHCGAQPDATTWMKVHHILDMREDTDSPDRSGPSSSSDA